VKKKLRNLKEKKNVTKRLYITCIILSIVLSCILATLTMPLVIPSYVIMLLSTSSAILTSISGRFNFQNKKVEINQLLCKIEKLKQKITYVIECNGNLTSDELDQITKEFI